MLPCNASQADNRPSTILYPQPKRLSDQRLSAARDRRFDPEVRHADRNGAATLHIGLAARSDASACDMDNARFHNYLLRSHAHSTSLSTIRSTDRSGRIAPRTALDSGLERRRNPAHLEPARMHEQHHDIRGGDACDA